MKKSTHILLTLVTSLVISGCAVNSNLQPSNNPADSYAMVASDSTDYYDQNYPYVYRWRLFDNCYRWFFPRRHYSIIHQPGYVPRYVQRSVAHGRHPSRDKIVHAKAGHTGQTQPTRPSHSRSGRTSGSTKRGGFGHTGSHHSSVG